MEWVEEEVEGDETKLMNRDNSSEQLGCEGEEREASSWIRIWGDREVFPPLHKKKENLLS